VTPRPAISGRRRPREPAYRSGRRRARARAYRCWPCAALATLLVACGSSSADNSDGRGSGGPVDATVTPVAAATPAAGTTPSAAGACPLRYYGTYSVGTRAGAETVPLRERVREVRDLGANMIVATGSGAGILELLPDGVLAVPGCGLMQQRDWKRGNTWDAAQARERLAKLAATFARRAEVFGICLTHEVEEYADHDRRVWMYRLAKEYFPDKAVIHYYATVRHRNAGGDLVDDYGQSGERETDALFVSLQAVRGRQWAPDTRRLEETLAAAARTPGVPVWAQTSINADHSYVKGAETMTEMWGEQGENMRPWVRLLLDTVRQDANGGTLALSGLFWRSLGRFPYDLGYPDFSAHRNQVRAIADECFGGAAPEAAP